jgi:hypothetical protein
VELPEALDEEVEVELESYCSSQAVVGSAAALYPVVKQNAPDFALGNVGLRILETGPITIGVVGLLTVATLRQDAPAGADTAELLTAGRTLVAIYGWAFLVGPNLVLATSTSQFLAHAMFRWPLVRRWIGVLGLVGSTDHLRTGRWIDARSIRTGNGVGCDPHRHDLRLGAEPCIAAHRTG